MKYVIATLVSLGLLGVFAVFACLIGWEHCQGMHVQIPLWLSICCVWSTLVQLLH